jgi:hypothetical protein
MSLAGYLAAHNGPTIPTEQIHKIVDYLLELVFPLFAGGAVLFRRLVDKKVNPDNAASSSAAMAGKAKQRQRKVTQATEERIEKAGATRQQLPDTIFPLPTKADD